jgi:Predicted metal-binding integral membrane protein (DUF2182)
VDSVPTPKVTDWKGASLGACRRPVTILARYRGGGLVDALLAGITYSRHCLVSGWALMLIMFSAGVADLAWMAALALTMLAEKTLPSGDSLRYVVAGALALLAAGMLLAVICLRPEPGKARVRRHQGVSVGSEELLTSTWRRAKSSGLPRAFSYPRVLITRASSYMKGGLTSFSVDQAGQERPEQTNGCTRRRRVT